MGYSGYIQYLCSNGHYTTKDLYGRQYGSCYRCKQSFVWENCVDTTNGSYDNSGNRIDNYVELEQNNSPVFETCPHCDNTKTVQEETYIIPKDKGRIIK